MSMKELLARVKAATGPDRELDAAIHAATNPPLRAGMVFGRVPSITASIDAAVAFAVRVLPGWRYDLHSPRMGQTWEAVLMDGDSASRKIRTGTAASAPLAIVAATLTALIAQEQTNDHQ